MVNFHGFLYVGLPEGSSAARLLREEPQDQGHQLVDGVPGHLRFGASFEPHMKPMVGH